MGIIDEVFSPRLIEEISEISGSYDIPSNIKRADAIIDLVTAFGFEEVGCGTNRICIFNKNYNKRICFMIALDNQGERDNNNEFYLSKDELLIPYIAETYENTSLICAQRKYGDMSKKKFKKHEHECQEIIKELSRHFLIDDAGPLVWDNWGIDQDTNEPKIIDYAYFTRLENLEHYKCDKCKGKLLYDKNLRGMICKKCGKHFTFSEIRGKSILDPIIEDGFQTLEKDDINENKERKIIEDWLNR